MRTGCLGVRRVRRREQPMASPISRLSGCRPSKELHARFVSSTMKMTAPPFKGGAALRACLPEEPAMAVGF